MNARDLSAFLGGQEKTFFFVDYEGMRQRQGLVFNDIVATPAMKQGDFGAPGLNTIYDPLTTANGTRTAFPGNKIPANRLSPQALFFNRYLSDPNLGARTAALPTQKLGIDQFTVRGDRTIDDRHRFFLRWSFDDYRQSDPNAFPALGYADLHTCGQNVVAGLTSSLSPNLVHEMRFSYTPQWIDLQAFDQGTNFNQMAGITGLDGLRRPGIAGSFPDFAWSGYTSLAGSSFDQRPKTQTFKVVEGIDNLTWIRGRHIFKFGAEIRYRQPLFTDSSNYQGAWSFSGIDTQNPAHAAGTGDGFADWMFGFPVSSARAHPADWFGGDAICGHFLAQDDFKVNNRLTLNLGLSYEYSPWTRGYKNQLETFDGTLAKPIIVASGNEAALWRAYGAARRIWHLLRNGEYRWPREPEQSAVSFERDGLRYSEYHTDSHACKFFPGPTAGQRRRNANMYTFAARRRPALEFRDTTATRARYGRRNRLRRRSWHSFEQHESIQRSIQDTPAAGGDFYFERALSSFDIPQNIAFNMGYALPIGRWLRNFDASVFKEFSITESSLLQFRAEFFNVTNTPTFGIPNTVTDTSSGGIVTTSANNSRQVQFALKFNF